MGICRDCFALDALFPFGIFFVSGRGGGDGRVVVVVGVDFVAAGFSSSVSVVGLSFALFFPSVLVALLVVVPGISIIPPPNL